MFYTIPMDEAIGKGYAFSVIGLILQLEHECLNLTRKTVFWC